MKWEIQVELAGGTWWTLCEVMTLDALYAIVGSLLGKDATCVPKIQIIRVDMVT
jgi:hypothetical protein